MAQAPSSTGASSDGPNSPRSSTKPFKHNKHKQDLLRDVRGMQNRRHDPACPLCLIWGVRYDEHDRDSWGRQHAHAALLWREWDGRRDWPERVARVASDVLGVEVRPEQARAHYTYHRPEQPHPPGKLDRRQALADAAVLSPTAQAILVALYRTRLLSRRQIVDLFYSSHQKRSAQTLANRDLQALAHGHFAYRLYPDPAWERHAGFPQGLAQEVFYLFGRNGAPLLEEHFGVRVWSDAATTMARQVGRTTFVHDWRANNVFVDLDRALRSRGHVISLPNGDQTRAYLLRENWYGARLIGMRLWSRRLLRELDMRPDGFCALSLERSGYAEDSLPSTQLPFFYEFDNETKEPHVVAEQMLNYHHLALSGEAGRRFPDLALEGYAVPMIMVFRGRGRVDEVGRSFRRRARREGYRDTGAPLFMVQEADWSEDPLSSELRLAWNDEPVSLVEALIRASARLLESRALTATQVLELDPTPSPRRKREAVERARRSQASPASSQPPQVSKSVTQPGADSKSAARDPLSPPSRVSPLESLEPEIPERRRRPPSGPLS